jgi:alpha-N-arabinofuranosidase
MQADIRIHDQPTFDVSEMILGHNIEAYDDTIAGLLSDRIDNAKFLGPADVQTGIAPGWEPKGRGMAGMLCQLTPGMSLSGQESQLINYFKERNGSNWNGIIQIGRKIRAGERLEVEIIAKVRHQPAPMRFIIAPLSARKPDYDMAEILIDAAWWRRYTATLTVPEDDDEATFSIVVGGDSYVWIDQVHVRPAGKGHVKQEALDAIKRLDVPALRFPGGCISTNYHWRHGTGPVHLRPELHDAVFKHTTCYDFGTDEYVDLCIAQGIRPFITINLGSGTPEEAADWASYCAARYRTRGHDAPAAYFMIGNENYGAWESGHMTGEMYAQAVLAYAPAIRKAYPLARIIAIGERQAEGVREDQRSEWLRPLLDKAADAFDIIGYTRYATLWPESDEDVATCIRNGIAKSRKLLERTVAELRKRNLPHKIYQAEWNYWQHASHWDNRGFYEHYDTQHCLFSAGMFHMFTRHGEDVEGASFEGLLNCMGMIQSHGPDVQESCLCDTFRFYRKAFPGKFVPLSLEGNGDGRIENIDALCLENESGRWLFVVNSDLSQAACIKAPGLPRGKVAGELLQGDNPRSELISGKVTASEGVFELPPLSIIRFSWK